MPQLMPLFWINSMFMVFLLLMMLMNLYFYKMENTSFSIYSIFKKNNFLLW